MTQKRGRRKERKGEKRCRMCDRGGCSDQVGNETRERNKDDYLSMDRGSPHRDESRPMPSPSDLIRAKEIFQ